MPELEELYQEYKDGPVGIVGMLVDSSGTEKIAGLTDGEKELGKTILKKTKVTYPQLTPSEALIKTNFKRIIEFPTTFFVDEDGNFVGKPVTGAKTKKEWIEIIEERLQKADNSVN